MVRERQAAARDESGGAIQSVSDDEILEAYRLLAQEEGIFSEPASAACVAGLIKLAADSGQRTAMRDETVVCVITGHGLKDPETALSVEGEMVEVPAEQAAVERAMGLR